MQYGRSAPTSDATDYYLADVARGLRARLDHPLDTRPSANRETAPDGRRVIAAKQGGNIDLFIIGLDGVWGRLTHFSDFSPARAERDARRANQYPAWSPDGAWIAFISADVNGRLSLYAVRPNGDDLRRLDDHIRVIAPVPPRWVILPTGLLGEMLAALVACAILLVVISRSAAGHAASSRG